MSQAKGAAKSAGILVAVALASKILGFLREQAIAYQFGASYLTDAYYVASIIPLMIFSSVNGALRHTLIPIFVEYLEKRGKQEAFRFANNVFNILAVILVFMVIGGYFLAPFLVKVIAPGFEGKAYQTAIELVKILIIVILFLGMAGVASGILNSFKDFTIPALTGLPQNIIIILSILVLGKTMGIYGLAIGTMVGIASQLFLQFPALKKQGMSWKFTFELGHPGVRKMALLVLPIFLGASVNQINVIVDRILASGLPEGSISALNFASRLSGLPLGLFTAAIATVLFPTFSEYAVKADLNKFKEAFYNGVKVILFLTVPITIGFIVLGVPMVQLLFQRGAFDFQDTNATAFALQFYALGIIAISLRELMNKVYFSLQDTKLPLITGAIGLVLNVISNLILVRYLAHGGLALGTSISAIVNVVIMFIYLPKKIGHLNYGAIGQYLGKITAAAAAMGAIIYLINISLPTPQQASLVFQLFKVGGLIVFGAVFYFTVTFFLKIEELHWLHRTFINKVYRRLHFQVRFFPIAKKVPDRMIKLPLQFVEATDKNIMETPNFRDAAVIEQFSQMLAAGQRGYFVLCQGKVVHHSWVLLNLEAAPLKLKHLEIPPKCAYIHYCSTREDLRGQGIFPWVLTKLLSNLQNEYSSQIHGVYIDSDVSNLASIKSQQKAGFESYAEVMDFFCLGVHKRNVKLLGSEKENE